MNIRDGFRTPETKAHYERVRAKRKMSGAIPDMRTFPVVREYTHWLIVENDFPYDAIVDIHHLLIPKRDTLFQFDREMSDEERTELFSIKEEAGASGAYDVILENLGKRRSIPIQFHLHLLKQQALH